MAAETGQGVDEGQGDAAIEYEDRLLLYMDVLGWSKLITDSVIHRDARETLAQISQRLRTPVQAMEHALSGGDDFGGIRVSQFSDTLVASCPIGNHRVVFALCVVAVGVGQIVIKRGYYVRGAMVQGKLIHRPGVIYGPALVAANQVEENVAKYPRIIVTPSAEESVGEAERNHGWALLCRDHDGLRYLNVLSPSTTSPDERAVIRADIERRRTRDVADLGLLSKHAWTLSYLDEIEHYVGRGAREQAEQPKTTIPV
jgi:hypothetical protein